MPGVISTPPLQRRNECRALSLMFAIAVNSGTRTMLDGMLPPFKKFDDLVVDAVDNTVEVGVGGLRTTAAEDKLEFALDDPACAG